MYFDSHCHLDFADFESDREQVIHQANSSGVKHILIPGIDAENWSRQLRVKENSSNIDIHLGFGFHPFFLSQQTELELAQLEQVASSNLCVAIGECGLDATVANMPLQQKVFEAQIALANSLNKPLIIHHRQSHHLIAQSFKRVRPKTGGFIHAFSGSYQQAKYYVDFGFKLGIGGVITYPRANKTKQSVKQIGLAHLVLETDAPDMPLANQQQKRNHPQNVTLIAKELASLFETDVEQVANITTANSLQVLSLT